MTPVIQVTKSRVALAAIVAALVTTSAPVRTEGQPSGQSDSRAVVQRYCLTCHNARVKAGGLLLDQLDAGQPEQHPEIFEKVVRKLRTGMMPPSGAPRPDRATLDRLAATVETALDRTAALAPNPGAPALHRLNRAEYANAIRDLLDLPIDAAAMLPGDDSSDGFDNIANVLSVSPALMQAYVSAAGKISRLAIGDPTIAELREGKRLRAVADRLLRDTDALRRSGRRRRSRRRRARAPAPGCACRWHGSDRGSPADASVSFSTGTAAMSQVLRVAVSKVRMPRSQRMTFGLPCATMYSADISSSLMVELMPRFSSTGRPQRAQRFQQREVLHVARAHLHDVGVFGHQCPRRGRS